MGARESHRAAVTGLINNYVHKHSAVALRNESTNAPDELCGRGFVSNVHFSVGCQSMGNALGAFLSNLVFAVALNRTIFLTGPDQTKTDCFGHISIREWIISRRELEALLKNAGCPLNERNIDYWDCPPCGYTESQARVLTSDSLMNAVYLFLRHDYDPLTSPLVQQRSRTLFGSPYQDRAPFEAYGLLMKRAFHFSSAVNLAVRGILLKSNAPNTFRVSIHLRHRDTRSPADPSLDIPFDDVAVKALKSIVRRQVNSTCVVYLASDRNASIARMERSAHELGCEPYTVDRADESNKADGTSEHGVWALGLVQLADMYLLGHGDYFIGAKESSYSVLIANLVTANLLQQDRFVSNPLYWLFNNEFTPHFFPTKLGHNCSKGKYRAL